MLVSDHESIILVDLIYILIQCTACQTGLLHRWFMRILHSVCIIGKFTFGSCLCSEQSLVRVVRSLLMNDLLVCCYWTKKTDMDACWLINESTAASSAWMNEWMNEWFTNTFCISVTELWVDRAFQTGLSHRWFMRMVHSVCIIGEVTFGSCLCSEQRLVWFLRLLLMNDLLVCCYRTKKTDMDACWLMNESTAASSA